MAIRDLLVRIRGDSTEVDRDLLRTSRSIQKFGREMGRIGTVLSTRVTLPLLAVGAGALKVAADAEESEAKFSAVFQNMASEVRAWSEETATAFGRSSTVLRQFLSTAQDTFVPLGFARDRAADLSQQITALTLDLAAFNNESEPETLDRLTSALVGNHRAVRAYGVVLTEATLAAELQRSGMAENTKAATEQQKVLARLNIILNSTTDAHGTAAREAAGATAGWRGLTAAFQDAAIRIGDELLPLANQLQRWITAQIRAFDDLNPQTLRWGIALAGVAAALGPLVALLSAVAAGLSLVATALGVGLLPLIGVGGAVILALGGLAAAFLKTKLDAAAARGELDRYQTALRDLSREELLHEQTVQTIRLFDVTDEIDQLEALGVTITSAGIRRLEELRTIADGIIRKGVAIADAFGRLKTAGDDVGGDGAAARTLSTNDPASRLLGRDRLPYWTRGFGQDGGYVWDSPDFVAGIDKFREGLEILALSPAAIRDSGKEAERLVETLAPLSDAALGFVHTFADTFAAAMTDGAAAFQRFADYVIQQIVRVVARLALFRVLQGLFPGAGFVAQFGLDSGFLTKAPGTVNAGAAFAGTGGPQIAMALDLSRLPAPTDPRQAARDPDWLRFISQSFQELG